MQDLDDLALLREYAARHSDDAFAELVSRRVGFVHSAALRQVRDAHLAGEITQAVFIILARKAGKISAKTNLVGWFFRTTRFAALAQIRADAKRARQEKEFQMQSQIDGGAGFQPVNEAKADEIWNQMSPLLDEALAALGEKDRQAVLLRFFENKSLAEVGNNLGIGEDTARKRVSRALEKLHRYFANRGVSSTTGNIAEKISANSIQAAPIGLAKAISTVALAKGATASISTLTLIKGALKIMAWTKIKTAIVVGAALILAAGITTVAIKELSPAYDPWENMDGLLSEIDAIMTKHMHDTHPITREIALQQNKDFEDVYARFFRKVPVGVIIRETHYSNSKEFAFSQRGHNQIVARFIPFTNILDAAYLRNPNDDLSHYSPERTIFLTDLPTNRFDYLVNVPDHGLESLQEQLKKQFGLVGRVETVKTNVLVLKVKNPDAPGLHSQGHGGNSTAESYILAGSTYTLAQGLEPEFNQPVIDQTGLEEQFYDFTIPKPANLDSLKAVLLDQFGLELVPTNMPIEMLVVEKVK